MKKNKWLFIILVLLAAITVYVVVTRKSGTINSELHDFAVKDTGNISKIFLADRNGNSVTLERQSAGKWLLNNKVEPKYDLLHLLLAGIAQVEVRSPVAKAAYNNVVKTLAASAIKCEIYLKGEAVPFKTYYVGGQTQDELGTFMMLEHSSMPFITQIPGFNGYLTPRYSVRFDAWRSTIMFSYNVDDIKFLMVNFTAAPDKSYLISTMNGRYVIQNPASNEFILNIDTITLSNYLSQFRNVSFEAPIAQQTRDTLSLNEPSIRISIKDQANKLKEVSIFPVALTKRSVSQVDSTGKPLKYDLDRVYGLINPDNMLVTIQQQMLNRLLRQFKDFEVGHTTDKKHR